MVTAKVTQAALRWYFPSEAVGHTFRFKYRWKKGPEDFSYSKEFKINNNVYKGKKCGDFRKKLASGFDNKVIAAGGHIGRKKKNCPEGKKSVVNCRVIKHKFKSACLPGRRGCPYWISTRHRGVFRKARKVGRKYVCDEGRKYGSRTCLVKGHFFRTQQPERCSKPQGTKIPKGCTYWVSSGHGGVFRRQE